MKQIYLVLFLLLDACSHSVRTAPPVTPPSISFDQQVNNLLGGLGDCSTLQDHQDGTDLPDCQRIVAAIERGVARAIPQFPQAATMSFSPLFVHFHRKARHYDPSKPYPLIYGMNGSDADPQYVRGYTITADNAPGYIGIDVYYAYPEVLEHEVIHIVGYTYNRQAARTDAAIAMDDGGYPNWRSWGVPFPVYLIYCHGTIDDPFGELGNHASCAQPFPDKPWIGYVSK